MTPADTRALRMLVERAEANTEHKAIKSGKRAHEFTAATAWRLVDAGFAENTSHGKRGSWFRATAAGIAYIKERSEQ